ncbi:MAG: glucose 1-dehydrogenase [Candidatus Omnitrophica bacterium]|nr:Glucose 1-dehydrogenase [bacterium]NUN96125.1 glucose 1-dehydrogenase [Candidatus Omnitrophota bacterium]
MPKLEGKNVLITGASTGIGQAIAIRFAREGANVAINYSRSKEEAENTEVLVNQACMAVRESGCKDLIVQADVSQEDQVSEMFERVIREFGHIDILVNNAGVQRPVASHEMEMEDFDWVVRINLRGAWLCARAAIRHFLQRGAGGVILNNSSVHEIIPKPKYLSYSISKGGMENMTKTLALEYAGRGIRVNAVGPGATITPINRAWAEDPKAKAEVESHIPMGRAATSEEIAAAFAFLASDEASYITGQTLFVDGGLTLYPEFRVAWSSGE